MSFNLCYCSTALSDKRLVVSLHAIPFREIQNPDEAVMDQPTESPYQEEQPHGYLDLDLPMDANEDHPWSWS
jgi:hypothetical protein